MEADYAKILELLPHRSPFLMVDRVEDIVEGESATGIKFISLNDPVFQGHFPSDPIFPGVLIVEAMAQTAAVMALLPLSSSCSSRPEQEARPSVYFMTLDQVKFRHPVRPGEVLRLKVRKTQARGTVWKFEGEAFVNERLVAEASFMAMIKQS